MLSKEHPSLAESEVSSLLETCGGNVIAEEDEGILIGECCASEGRAINFDRLALTKCVCEFIGSPRELLLSPRKYKSFAVMVHGAKSEKNRKKIAAEVAAGIGGVVDLEQPETRIHAFATEEGEILIGRQIADLKLSRFRSRDVNFRPAFHPASLQPKWGRVLVNLARLREEHSMLDPFCGIGGILIEASFMGMKATGLDMDPKSAESAKRNLAYYGAHAKVVNADFLEYENNGTTFDAIVTDLPYGTSSPLFSRKLDDLYSGAFERMQRFANRAVIMAPLDCGRILESCGWRLERKFSLRVHKSLTRWIHVISSNLS